MLWSDQYDTGFCSNLCELASVRFDAVKYWEKHVCDEANESVKTPVPDLSASSRVAE